LDYFSVFGAIVITINCDHNRVVRYYIPKKNRDITLPPLVQTCSLAVPSYKNSGPDSIASLLLLTQ